MENFTIELGKYTYEYNEGEQAIFRNGSFYCFHREDYILAMAMRIKALEEEVENLLDEINSF
ncbi:hypothetical protein [Vibrio phage JSF13]|jgi:hypothetical protein|uniref:hypothetical protein n=1 Tax=Vibrio cholerae TaxID=666 RepID=UPI0001FF8D41|nr:hypothetical protein TUST1-2_00705 [Vibrio phage ICP1_2001_A]APD18001.1 hypothetical protein [Vibrio phage JSF4]ASV41463.1 hypothetical protein [Vibrio phage JSF6]ASV42124.1 hypothetical protein [Vibrio phage JSF13]ASV42524.1 hypothetical protein [Vibrio phage JSF14]ASV42650.1 hypothetical protein [Vibrio phage JSF17]AXQ70983.1 hypothetical protein ICP12012A_131 [Vibrio phage ICP1_2012_A]AXY82234.1 hypothetical protein ICP12011A_140 [Vibrio phage ICP1_2011_A]AXY82453.1 hypothetical prote